MSDDNPRRPVPVRPRVATATPPDPGKPVSTDIARGAVGALEDTTRSSDPNLRASSECPSDDVISAHVAGKLEGPERERFIAHLDGCAACRSVVMHAVRAVGVADVPSQRETAVDARATKPRSEAPHRVGRFTILNQLGAGGMGVVYAAYDTQLDRKVAVKLVRTDLRDHRPEATRKAMLREAKAMAKVEHPNVITVFEVGTFDDQVFVAMELVTGGDLRMWMTTAQRTWREVLEICNQAGKGLAAAHRASLVHRDFKPDNVLVGSDGRVRVTDFGLARPVLTPSEPVVPTFEVDTPAASAAGSDRLTRTGALVGTPAYMAPEQHRAEPADERSDQFAFCVTVWEALYGERPFEGATFAALAINVQDGNVREPPRGTIVPPRIRAALRRGLSVNPADRFPSIDALLSALTLQRGRTLAVAVAAVGLVAIAVGTTWVATRGSPEAGASCPDPATKLAGIWDTARRASVTRSLTAAAPFGVQAAERVSKTVDAYAEQWGHEWSLTCKARGDGEQSATMFDLRVECLTQRLHALDTFLGTLAAPSAALAAKAGTLAEELDPVAVCSNAALARLPPLPMAMRTAYVELDDKLDKLTELRNQGRYDELRPLLDSAVTEARRIGFRPLTARALFAQGMVQVDVGNFAEAEKLLQAASSDAIASNDDWTAAQALAELVEIVGYHLGRPAESHRLADLANASLERAGNPKPLRVTLLGALSRVYLLEGKHAEALAEIDKALAIVEDNSGDMVALLSAKGLALVDLGKFDEARSLMERELAIITQIAGKQHPQYASSLENRATLYFAANEFEKGIADLQEARRIQVAAFGPDTGEIVGIENNLGVIAGLLGDWEEALRAARVAVALSERHTGAKHPNTAKARANVGAALRNLGKLDEAERELQAAQKIREEVLGVEHQDYANGLAELGELRLRQNKPAEAIVLFQRAYKTMAAAVGDDNHEIGYSMSGLGRAQLAAKDVKAARTTLTATVAALEQTGVDPVLLARTRLALADATWQLGERTAAIAIAAKAEPDLATLPATANKPLRASIAAWRASHR